MSIESQQYGYEQEARTQPSFDEFANDLLEDTEIKKLPADEQGHVIADRFIGMIYRHGEVQGRSASYTPEDVVLGIDDLSREGQDGLKYITNTDGLRKAVAALAVDERVGPLVGSFEGRVARNEQGEPVLTSMAQIEGYITAGGRANYNEAPVGGVDMYGDQWIPVVTEHIQRMSESSHIDWLTDTRARDLTTSSSPLIKNTGRDWLMSMSSAEKAGVDRKLMQRSAEYIQERVQTSRKEMGATALALATGSRIGAYRQSLDARSGF